jgi:hypothetical protein
VPGDRDRVGQPRRHLRDAGDQGPRALIRPGAAEGEHRLPLGVDQLDAQTFRHLLDQQLAAEVGERGIRGDHAADLRGRAFEGLSLSLFVLGADLGVG